MYERRLARAWNDRAAVLERPVVAEDDVQHRLRELGGESIEPFDHTPDAVVAQRNLAVQAAVVGHRDRPALDAVRVELADVV